MAVAVPFRRGLFLATGRRTRAGSVRLSWHCDFGEMVYDILEHVGENRHIERSVRALP